MPRARAHRTRCARRPIRRRAAELRARGQAHHAPAARRRRRRVRDAGLPRRPRRRHREARARPRTAPSTCTSPTRKSCSARSAEDVATEMQALAESLPPLTPGARRARAAAGVDRGASPTSTSTTDRSSGRGPKPRSAAASSAGSAPTCSPSSPACSSTGIAEAAPPDLDPAIAALALVAMLERLNYYVLTQPGARRPRDDDRHARRRHPRRAVRRPGPGRRPTPL